MAIRFTNILKDLIIESSRFQVLFDKFVKPKERGQRGIMPFETLFALIAADPAGHGWQDVERPFLSRRLCDGSD